MASQRRKGNAKGSAKGDGRTSTPGPREPIAPPAGAPTPPSQPFENVALDGLRQPSLPFPVVCVGASAGGLEAFTQLLEAMPTNTGMAFVLVSHLSPSHASHLAEILSRATRMPVNEVKDEPKVDVKLIDAKVDVSEFEHSEPMPDPELAPEVTEEPVAEEPVVEEPKVEESGVDAKVDAETKTEEVDDEFKGDDVAPAPTPEIL